MAKIASDLRKPDGLVVVPPGERGGVPRAAPDRAGCGASAAKTAAMLSEYGVRTIGDLAALPADLLVRRFGKLGASLGDRARGIDADPVRDGDPAKSVGHEHTFDVDTHATARSSSGRCSAMAEGVAGRLRLGGREGGDGDGQDPRLVVPHDHPAADADRADRPDRADLPDGARPGPARGARDEGPAARGHARRTSASASSCRCSAPTIRAGGARSRRRMRVRRRYGERAVTRARLLGTGLPAPFERDDAGRHATRSDDAAPVAGALRQASLIRSDDDEAPA